MRKIALGLLLVTAGLGMSVGSAHAADGSTANTKDQPQKHKVVSGESLSSIAAASQLPTWRPIWNANAELQNPDQINPDQELIIPKPDEQTTDRPLPAGYGEPVVAAPVASAPVARKASPVVRGAVTGDLAYRIRMRESGNNYANKNNPRYRGAYQYDYGTWNNYGGYHDPADAPPAVQDAKFQETYARRGCSPWPNTCY